MASGKALSWKAGLVSRPITPELIAEAARLMLEQREEPRTRVVSPVWWHRATAFGPHTPECEEMWGLLSDSYDTWPEDCCGYAARWASR